MIDEDSTCIHAGAAVNSESVVVKAVSAGTQSALLKVTQSQQPLSSHPTVTTRDGDSVAQLSEVLVEADATVDPAEVDEVVETDSVLGWVLVEAVSCWELSAEDPEIKSDGTHRRRPGFGWGHSRVGRGSRGFRRSGRRRLTSRTRRRRRSLGGGSRGRLWMSFHPKPLHIKYTVALRRKVFEQAVTEVQFSPAAGRTFVHHTRDGGLAKRLDFL